MITKDQEKEFYRLIGMLAKLAVRINIETDYCVFMSVRGHIQDLEVHVASSKTNYNDNLFERDFYTVIGEPLNSHRQVDISRIKDVYRSLSRFLDSDVDVEKILEAA